MQDGKASYIPGLIRSAWGGLIIGAFLLLVSHSSLPGASEASATLKTFAQSFLKPEPAILVPLLFAGGLMLALTGVSWVHFLTKWLLRPALDFCSELCRTAAGVAIPMAFAIESISLWRSILMAAAGFVVIGSAGWVFHAASKIWDDLEEDSPNKERKRKLVTWISFIGTIAFAAIIYRFRIRQD